MISQNSSLAHFSLINNNVAKRKAFIIIATSTADDELK